MSVAFHWCLVVRPLRPREKDAENAALCREWGGGPWEEMGRYWKGKRGVSVVHARHYGEGGGGRPDVDIFTPSGEVTEKL